MLKLTGKKIFTIFRSKILLIKTYALGTEMRIPTLQDEAVSTPLGLKTVLDNPYLRQQYVIDADNETTTMAAYI